MAKIEIIKGDITKQHVEAIVNAANISLLGGGGVDGAIHRAAGPELVEECRTVGRCPTGEVRITKGYKLPVKYVIHAVGPVYHSGSDKEKELLASCYRNALEVAKEHDVKSIAFSSISTGAYRFPLDKAAPIALNTIFEFSQNNNIPNEIYMVCFDDRTFDAYQNVLQSLESRQ
jgi:O-acetyl-ADP-ribose deacetylase (regulator of RNase III)